MRIITATRTHEIACGHRVYGHESKCAHFHGHNYTFTFTVTGKLDSVGRVLDFSVIKSHLCQWLEENWDHRMLLWDQDPQLGIMTELDPDGVVAVPFNPTAENMANFFLDVAPGILQGTTARLVACRVQETGKCSAEAFFSE